MATFESKNRFDKIKYILITQLKTNSSIRKHCRLDWGVMLWLVGSEKKHIYCFPTNENLWIKIIREAWFQCQIIDPNNRTNMKFNYYTNKYDSLIVE